MTQATITIEDIPATVQGISAKLVRFQGQLDESNVDEKAKTIYQLLEQTPANLYLLFDFEQLEYMNSKSIGYLTDWYGKISEGQGKIVIAKPRSNILDILQVVGLTQLINCYQTLDEAKFALLQNLVQPASAPDSAAAPVQTPAPAVVQTTTVAETPAPAQTPVATETSTPSPADTPASSPDTPPPAQTA